MLETINAKIVADSKSPQGKRITTYLLTYPRSIHSELMTHRLFSRNAASSRAIPFSKMVDQIQNDPFIPIAWQKKHTGMQGSEYHEDPDILIETWLSARDEALKAAKRLDLQNATKQVVNRLIEPWVWYHVLVTFTEGENFFKLRCPKYPFIYGGDSSKVFHSRKDFNKYYEEIHNVPMASNGKDDSLGWIKSSTSGAEIHIQALAESMWDAKNESIPKELKAGEWHIPFGDRIDLARINYEVLLENVNDPTKLELKIATARCARLSYDNFNEEIDFEKDIELHDRLLFSGHMSPFEHCAKAMSDNEYSHFLNGYTPGTINISDNIKGWCMNFKGFIQYRYIVEQNNSRE